MGIPPFRLVLVVVINSRLGGPASVPAFALLRPSRLDCIGHCLADALLPVFTGGCCAVLLHGGRFATIVALVVDHFRRMLCRVDALPPLSSKTLGFLGDVVSFSRFSCLVGSSFVDS